MAVEEISSFKYTCDVASCSKKEVVDSRFDPGLPKGWIKGTAVDGYGIGGDWMACGPSHIKDAVLSVYQGGN